MLDDHVKRIKLSIFSFFFTLYYRLNSQIDTIASLVMEGKYLNHTHSLTDTHTPNNLEMLSHLEIQIQIIRHLCNRLLGLGIFRK